MKNYCFHYRDNLKTNLFNDYVKLIKYFAAVVIEV